MAETDCSWWCRMERAGGDRCLERWPNLVTLLRPRRLTRLTQGQGVSALTQGFIYYGPLAAL